MYDTTVYGLAGKIISLHPKEGGGGGEDRGFFALFLSAPRFWVGKTPARQYYTYSGVNNYTNTACCTKVYYYNRDFSLSHVCYSIV